MKTSISVVAAGCVLLASCAAEPTNPSTLWLALDGAETRVTLIDHEPPPY